METEGTSTDETDAESQIGAAESDATQTDASSELSPSRRSLLRVAGGFGLATTGLPALTDPGRAGGKRHDTGDGQKDCEPTQTAKLLADDGEAGDNFGNSIAMDGDTALIGTRWFSYEGPSSGSVYAFRRQGDQWTQETMLLPDEDKADDDFGSSVAVDGATAVVGARADDENGFRAGAAYVFSRQGGQWQQVAKLLPDDGESRDSFGDSVDVDGNTIIVGARGDGDNGRDSGSAYVFTRQDGHWTQAAKLLADDGGEYDLFGSSVAVSRNTAVVGAPGDGEAGDNSGSIYFFRRQGGEWTQERKILAEERALFFEFGNDVALDGDIAAAGVFNSDAENIESGVVYVYQRRGGQWREAAKLVADDGGELYYGSLVIDGTTIAVSATPSEAAYLFKRQGDQWRQAAKLVADDGERGDPNVGKRGDSFGVIAIEDNTAIVGAPGDDDNGTDSGSAYVFELCGPSEDSPGECKYGVETECERYDCECVEVCVSGSDSDCPVTAELVYECGKCGSDTHTFESDGCHAFTVPDGCTPDCVKFYRGNSVEGKEIPGTRIDPRDLSC